MCETWLNSEISDSVVSVAGYNFFRNDSPTNLRKHGVGIYIGDDIKVGRTFSDHPNTVGVCLPDFGVTILVVYRPPSNSLVDNLALISYLESVCEDKELILVGDFNLPSIDWSSDVPVGGSLLGEQFLDFFSSLGLIQWVKHAT